MIRWTFNNISARTLILVLALSVAAALFSGCGSSQPSSQPATVSGTVTVHFADALVYIYQEGEDIYGPARVISEPTSIDGSFSLSLKPGKYVAVVRKRVSGETAGPVLIGDYRSEPMAFEVGQGAGEVVLSITAGLKVSNEKAFPTPSLQNGTGIAGRVINADGNPVEGMRVHIYDHIQMSERPKYVSERTGADGKYFTPVKRGGTYYLAARDRFGGPPQIGDLFGRYDEGTVDPSGVVVRKGEMTGGIEITVHKVW